MKNDLAFILAGVLNLYEHQSTVNPNLPVRFLIYLAQKYQGIIEKVPQSLYGSRQIMLPTPHCVVFYNGDKEVPEEQTLRLSEAFENKDQKADRKAALNDAIDYCTEHHILEEFLRKYRAEVLGMLLEEFDVKKYERSLKEEGREEGIERGRTEGIEQGRTEGRAEGEQRINELYKKLKADNRIDDFLKAMEDTKYRNLLFKEYGL